MLKLQCLIVYFSTRVPLVVHTAEQTIEEFDFEEAQGEDKEGTISQNLVSWGSVPIDPISVSPPPPSSCISFVHPIFLAQIFVGSQDDLDWGSITYSAKQNKKPERKQEEDIKTLNMLQYSLREGAQKRSSCKEEARAGKKK